MTHVSRRPGGVTLQPVTPFGAHSGGESQRVSSVKLNPSKKKKKKALRGKSTCLPCGARGIPLTTSKQRRLFLFFRAATGEAGDCEAPEDALAGVESPAAFRSEGSWTGPRGGAASSSSSSSSSPVLLLLLLLLFLMLLLRAARRFLETEGGIPSQITSKHTRAHWCTHSLTQCCARSLPFFSSRHARSTPTGTEVEKRLWCVRRLERSEVLSPQPAAHASQVRYTYTSDMLN